MTTANDSNEGQRFCAYLRQPLMNHDALGVTGAAELRWSVSLLPAPDGPDWNDGLTGKAVAA